jgi:redox-sensitive bicupin YhaK (pirin superfamily)
MHNRAVVRANDVQRMSAGTGVMHSEMNEGSVPVHLYQIWILPGESGLAPSYDQRSYDPGSWRNVLFPVASGRGVTETVTMHADATIFRSDLDKGRSLAFGGTGRRAFVYMTAGSLSINGTVLGEGDQGRIEVNDPLSMEALEDSRFVFIDLP